MIDASQNSLDIFSLVLIGNSNVPTSGFEIYRLRLAKLFVFDGEGLIENVGNIIVQHPGQVFMVLFIDAFHVINGDFLSQHHLVECANKERV